jgi:hypothetical protein
VLDTSDAGVGRLFHSDGRRHMSGEGETYFGRLGGDGEEDFARGMIVNLNEIHAQALEAMDGLDGLLRIANAEAIAEIGRSVIDDGSGGDDLGADERAGVDAVAEGQDEIGIASHIASPDDSLGDEQVEAIGSSALMMGVHVPKAGNEEFPGSVEAGGFGWDGDFGADGGNAIPLGKYSDAISPGSCDDVDYGHVGDGDRWAGRRGSGGKGQETHGGY